MLCIILWLRWECIGLMAAEKEGKYHAFFSALQSAGNRELLILSALEEMFGLPVAKLLMPLLLKLGKFGVAQALVGQHLGHGLHAVLVVQTIERAGMDE